MLCRAMVKPTPELQSAALRVLGYLYRTKHLGLRYRADSQPARGYSDSDWAVKHSTSGFVFMYNSAAVNWGSKKQASVALSSCEAEIMAASLAASVAPSLAASCPCTNSGDQELKVSGQEAETCTKGPRGVAVDVSCMQMLLDGQQAHLRCCARCCGGDTSEARHTCTCEGMEGELFLGTI